MSGNFCQPGKALTTINGTSAALIGAIVIANAEFAKCAQMSAPSECHCKGRHRGKRSIRPRAMAVTCHCVTTSHRIGKGTIVCLLAPNGRCFRCKSIANRVERAPVQAPPLLDFVNNSTVLRIWPFSRRFVQQNGMKASLLLAGTVWRAWRTGGRTDKADCSCCLHLFISQVCPERACDLRHVSARNWNFIFRNNRWPVSYLGTAVQECFQLSPWTTFWLYSN